MPHSLRKRQPCYALQGPDASTELQMIAALKSLSPEGLPLLASLLGPPCKSAWPHGPIHPQPAQPATDSAPAQHSFQEGVAATAGPSALHGHQQPAVCMSACQQTDRCAVTAADSMQSSLPTQPQHSSAPPASPSQAAREGDSDFEEPAGRPETTQSCEGGASQDAALADSVDADSVIQRFGLNAEQAAALRAIPGASQVHCLHTASQVLAKLYDHATLHLRNNLTFPDSGFRLKQSSVP